MASGRSFLSSFSTYAGAKDYFQRAVEAAPHSLTNLGRFKECMKALEWQQGLIERARS